MLTFSIILPTYNRGYIIWKTIQSVQKQIYPHWELLIIDDGSTDNTEQVVAQFQKDPRISYKKIQNAGVANARNIGFKKAQGDIIVYLDSDDTLYENFLTTLVEFLKRNPHAVFGISNYNRRIECYDEHYQLLDFKESTSFQKETITLQDIYHWQIKTTSTGLFHTREAKKTIKWNTEITRFEDWDFLMQLGEKYPQGFLHIPYVLFQYRERYGTDSLCSTSTYSDWADSFEKIYQKHKNSPCMQGQDWYPAKVNKYKERQELFEKGKFPSPAYKNFPEYFKKK
ncbi:MAG: glycosyltransferase family A protein [Patescibacteria group bacterium]